MVTKESLLNDKERANVALLKLKQEYSKNDNKVYFVVEGKDDVAFYTCISKRYQRLSRAVILPANCRKNVISTFDKLDWNYFSKDRVLFFVDRDLSDITKERTPDAPNIYVTDNYSIENSIFNVELFLTALENLFGVSELNSDDIQKLSLLYTAAQNAFMMCFMPVMCWILCWRINNTKCNLKNINDDGLYWLHAGVFEIKDEYRDQAKMCDLIHKSCGVTVMTQDVDCYKQIIEENGGIQKCIRGKFLKNYFVKFINSIYADKSTVLPGKNAKAVVSLGSGNAVQLLSGYADTPKTLDSFLRQHGNEAVLE